MRRHWLVAVVLFGSISCAATPTREGGETPGFVARYRNLLATQSAAQQRDLLTRSLAMPLSFAFEAITRSGVPYDGLGLIIRDLRVAGADTSLSTLLSALQLKALLPTADDVTQALLRSTSLNSHFPPAVPSAGRPALALGAPLGSRNAMKQVPSWYPNICKDLEDLYNSVTAGRTDKDGNPLSISTVMESVAANNLSPNGTHAGNKLLINGKQTRILKPYQIATYWYHCWTDRQIAPGDDPRRYPDPDADGEGPGNFFGGNPLDSFGSCATSGLPSCGFDGSWNPSAKFFESMGDRNGGGANAAIDRYSG